MVADIFPSIAAIAVLALLGVGFGLFLSIAKIVLRVEKDPRIESIDAVLPGANCGACGLPGCSAYATKIVEDKYSINLCPVGGSEVTRQIAEIMGVEAEGASLPVRARVHCHGGNKEAISRFVYQGPKSCSAAQSMMDGFKGCEYGCLGQGDCVVSCPFDAIHMSDNGLPVIDLEKCVGCGKCVTACPRSIISLVGERFDVYVMCRNKEKGAQMKQSCSVGCIGCKLCEKACKETHADNPDVETSIVVTDFCAAIDYTTCINCYKCVEVCPVPVIDPLMKSKKMRKQLAAAQETKAPSETALTAENQPQQGTEA